MVEKRRNQKLTSEARGAPQDRGAERTIALEKANEELRAAQAELERRWQYLAEAQRLSHSGTFGWKVSSGELIWSDETYKILGFARETNPTLDLVFERIHPDDVERLQEVRDRAVREGMDLDLEHRILLPNGVIKHLHVVAHAGTDRAGIREYMGVVTDITERKRAEEDRQALARDLQESNLRLEEAQRIAHVGHWEWDLNTNRLICSAEYCRIHGHPPTESPMELALVTSRIHPEDRDAVLEYAAESIRSGTNTDIKHRLLLPNGEVRFVHSLADLKKDSSGRPYQMFGTTQDITDQTRAEEERKTLLSDLQENKAWLEEAQRVAHIGYWVWDLQTNQLIWSDETYRIFGLTPHEGPFDLARMSEMIHPDDRDFVFRTAEEAVRSGVRADCEHRLIRPDGEMRVVHSLGDLKKDSSGRPYKMFGTSQDITDRKRADEALERMSRNLQESKDRLEEAQRVAHIGHYEWNLITNHQIWSDELYRIYGLPPREGTIDMAIVREMMHPDDRADVFNSVDEVVRSGLPGEAEHRIIRPNGEVRTVHALGTVKKDASGRVYEIFGTVQDITERKHAEEALQRNQFYLSEGQRIAHIGSWAFNESGHYWSDELFKIYGLDPQAGAPSVEEYLALVHPQDRAAMEQTIKRMQEDHCGFDQIERIVRPDGELRYVRAVAVPMVEQGVFKGFVGTTMDVTERELLTDELRRERAYLADAQRLTHVGSWACNFLTGRILHLSDEALRFYGFDPSEGPVPFERLYKATHPEDEAALREKFYAAIQARSDYDLEYRIIRPDGDVRCLRSIGHHNRAGDVGDYVGITMDVTERKRAEQERERLRQLEADLAHTNRVNMMGELAAALAHEIKQPIAASVTSAGACLRWLAHDPPDLERARAAASRMKDDGHRAADVINRLRSFYKKDAPTQREVIDIKTMVRQMTTLLSGEATPHAITISSDLESGVSNVVADRVQLQQVFMNLMLNGIESMKDSGGKLTISSGLNPEGQLLISVSDTGVGLSPDNTERIFEAFHTTKPQGTGMGLTITRSIVESHGGRIWATPNQGPGATFHFTVPVEAKARV